MLLAAALLVTVLGSATTMEISRPRPAVRAAYAVAIEPGCVESELRSRKLNRWGDPEGTTYPGDTPPDLESVTAGSFDPEQVAPEDRTDAARVMYVLRHIPTSKRHVSPASRCWTSPADVELVRWSESGDEAVLRLTPSGTANLERFTRANVGRMAIVSIDGVLAVRAVVQGVINSGSVSVRSPSPALRDRLQAVRGDRETPAQKPPATPGEKAP
jgi:hypothetical protein